MRIMNPGICLFITLSILLAACDGQSTRVDGVAPSADQDRAKTAVPQSLSPDELDAQLVADHDYIERPAKHLLRIKLQNGTHLDFEDVEFNYDFDAYKSYRVNKVLLDRYVVVFKSFHECFAEAFVVDVVTGSVSDLEPNNLVSPGNKWLLSYRFGGHEEMICQYNAVKVFRFTDAGLASQPLPEEPERWGVKTAVWEDEQVLRLVSEIYSHELEGGGVRPGLKFLRHYDDGWFYQDGPGALTGAQFVELQQKRKPAEQYTARRGVKLNEKSPRELLSYTVRRRQDQVYASFAIDTMAGDTLWRHDYRMEPKTLEAFLQANDNIDLEHWVHGFLEEKLRYGVQLRDSSSAGEGTPVFVTYYADSLHTPVRLRYSSDEKRFVHVEGGK